MDLKDGLFLKGEWYQKGGAVKGMYTHTQEPGRGGGIEMDKREGKSDEATAEGRKEVCEQAQEE